jgi:hypothetical protein
LRELQAAKERGDTARVHELLSDPKLRKTLKDIKGYVPFDEPQAQKPPGVTAAEKVAQESANQQQQKQQQQGVLQRMKDTVMRRQQAPPMPRQIGSTPNPQEIAAAQQARTGQTVAERQGQIMRESPLAQTQAAMGSPYSPEQTQHLAMQEAGWLGMSPRDFQTAMVHGEQIERTNMIRATARMAEVDTTTQGYLMEALIRAASDKEKAEIMSGWRYSQVKMMRDLKDKMMQIGAGKGLNDRLKMQQDGLVKMYQTLEQSAKNPNLKDDERTGARQQMQFLKPKIDDLQRQMNALSTYEEFKTLGIDITGGGESPASTPPPQSRQTEDKTQYEEP